MGAVDLVVTVGADQQQVSDVGAGQERLEEQEGGRVGPLQIVQEHYQGMLLPGQRAQQALDGEPEAVLSLRRPESRRLRLGPEDELDLGNDRRQYVATGPERVGQPPPPSGQALFTLGQELPEQPLEGLDEGAIGRAGDLIELAGGEVAALADDRLVELLDERGLADPRVPRHHREDGGPRAAALEGSIERIDIAVPSVQLLRNEEAVRDVALPEREVGDGRARRLRPRAALQVLPQPEGALIPLFRPLGHQLHDDARHGLGNPGVDFVGRLRDSRQMSVDELERVVRPERGGARQRLVQRDPEGVQVRPVVRGAIHAAGLLRRHVAERAAAEQTRGHRRHFGPASPGEGEIQQRGLAPRPVEHDAARAHPRVDQVSAMDLGQHRAEPDREAEDPGQVQTTRAEEGLERRPTLVRHHQTRRPLAAVQLVHPRDARHDQLPAELVLARQELDGDGRHRVGRGCLEEDGLPIGPPAAPMPDVPLRPEELFEDLVGRCHGGLRTLRGWKTRIGWAPISPAKDR
jgi:hypothetical protein